MKKRLFWVTTLILFVGLLLYFGASMYVAYNNNVALAKDAVMETTQIYANLYTEGADLVKFVQAGDEARVTVIAPDGSVLADSNPLDLAAMENHLSRPEVQAAANGKPESFVRYSSTLGAELIYYALQVGEGNDAVFIRVGVPVAEIDAYLFQSLPLLVVLLLCIAVLCFFFVRGVISHITRPFGAIEAKLRRLASGDYTAQMPEISTGNYEEIDEIVQGIDEVAGVLQSSFHALRDEKEKLDYILNNIGDGLFVVDEESNIVLLNAAVLDIFHAKPGLTGKKLNYLSYNQALAAAVEESAGSGKNILFEMPLDGRIYVVQVKRLPETRLTMAVLSDVTENRENAKHREEFFANASHELKTPLTAIKGFNELAAMNSNDEGAQKYIASISRETSRMLLLIEDMLRLSEIENKKTVLAEAVSLGKIAGEVREALDIAIEEKAIAFTITGDAVVKAEASHVYDLMKNLAENAVRYNGRNGHVFVTIEAENELVRMTVSDDGIGIPLEEQSRIFERFYRVEKSRSQKNGGTGLGLSIAKHICVLYGWELSLKSRPGVGTEIRVEFS